MFYGRYDYPQVNSCGGNLRYQRVSEYNLQTFLNMKNSKLKGGTDYVSKKRLLWSTGVSRDADKNTIKKAYRKLAKYHPIQTRKCTGGRALEATEAYNILSDPEKKKMQATLVMLHSMEAVRQVVLMAALYSRNGGVLTSMQDRRYIP